MARDEEKNLADYVALCVSCYWRIPDNIKSGAVRIAKEHCTDGCGPVLIASPEGIGWGFPGTVLPYLIRRTVEVLSPGMMG